MNKQGKLLTVMLAGILALTGCKNSIDTSVDDTSPTTLESVTVSDTEDVSDPVVESYESKYRLCNENASDSAKKIYDYICENFGTYMLSCQQESTWMGSPDYEMDIIEETTGKLPAMRGLDYMNNDFEGVNERAAEWWNKGGLVTICWHTGVISSGYQETLDDDPDFDKMLTEGTDEYNELMESWDKAAKALRELRDKDVPVLWRPFHEFDGAWFWWGKGGSENFIKLWRLMYDKFTNEYELNNLIWVLGYSGEVKENWYVGDDYCDIIGSDTYDNSTHKAAWEKLQNINAAGKPMAFHECGTVPRPERFKSDECIWSWFMVWHTDYISNHNKNLLDYVYNSELVITLDELPDLK
ncbi:MAG: glycoside hydrolase family 26 protein [Ruminococcus sp.]|nr:glycoside hydrolase family 26 protein [Ruminococcus sp.]